VVASFSAHETFCFRAISIRQFHFRGCRSCRPGRPPPLPSLLLFRLLVTFPRTSARSCVPSLPRPRVAEWCCLQPSGVVVGLWVPLFFSYAAVFFCFFQDGTARHGTARHGTARHPCHSCSCFVCLVALMTLTFVAANSLPPCVCSTFVPEAGGSRAGLLAPAVHVNCLFSGFHRQVSVPGWDRSARSLGLFFVSACRPLALRERGRSNGA